MALNDLRLTFRDEFNSLSLDTGTAATDSKLWNSSMHNGYVRSLSGNNEKQIYMDSDYKGLGVNPFSVNNGILTIKAAPSSSAVKNATGYGYTSGALTTEGEFSQKYGYFEMRAEVPEGKGLWPAFWLLADHGDWPPELDIMEVIGSEPHKLHQTIHSDYGNKGKATYFDGKLSDSYHTFGMDWTKSNITFYLDGKATATMATPADMHSSMYVLLNLAVGGNWPGSPNSTTNWADAKYNIDYVRVYQHTGVAGSGGVLPPGSGGSTGGGTTTPTPTTPSNPTTPTTPSNPTTPTTPTTASGLVFSNGSDITGSTGAKFVAGDTGANSSKTYSGSQLGIGAGSTNNVTVSFDAEKDVKVVHNGAWGAVKNASYTSSTAKEVTLENFTAVNVTLTGNKDSTVSATAVKRGSIVTGSGADKITVVGTSENWDANGLTISSGEGADVISYTGEADNRITVNAGGGNDTINVSGKAYGTVNAGAGDDKVTVRSASIIDLKLTGGAGKDSYDLSTNSRVVITDFKAGEDKLTVAGVAASSLTVRRADGNTYVERNGTTIANLNGVSLTAADMGLTGGTTTPTPPTGGGTTPPTTPTTSIPSFDSKTAMPTALLTPDPVFTDWPQTNVKFSNTEVISTSDGSTFIAPKTGANTSTTYSGSELGKIDAPGSSGSLTVAYDAQKNMTVSNGGAWGSVKNASIRTMTMNAVTVKNMVGVDLDMSGNQGDTVNVTGVKHGSIATGSGNDTINVTGSGGGVGAANLMTISAGNGANKVNYNGTNGNRAAIIAGSGADTITLAGQSNGAINAGAGNDRVNVRSTGNVSVTGGAGADVFSFIAGAHATITDFKAGEDRIEIAGATSSAVQVRNNGTSTLIDLNGSNAVVLSGVSLNASQLNLAYA